MKGLLCVWGGLVMGAMAKTVVWHDAAPAMSAEAPFAIPAPVVPEKTALFWAAAEKESADVAAQVRRFLVGEHAAQEKIDVLTWWAGRAESPDFLVDLASRCAALGKIDAAVYWLQRAAAEDGCDVEDVKGEESLAAVRADARWAKLKGYLEDCAQEWRKSSYFRHVLTLPDAHDGKEAIPMVIALHGYGSVPEDFADADFKAMSNALGVAFLSVSGRLPLGRNSFMWSGDFERDWRHIESALERASGECQPMEGKMAVMGFSQGGQLAAELTAGHPQRFRGCISMSPGSRFASGLVERLEKNPASLAGQQYFFTWITGEGAGPQQRVQGWRPVLEKSGARVYRYAFPGKGHTFPRNDEDYFSIALQVIFQ
jgi:predicted esterase